MKIMVVVFCLILTGCRSSLEILDGATHARGTIHVEGFYTDSQGDVLLCKVPSDYTPEQATNFCLSVE